MRSRKGLFWLCWERVRRLPVALVYYLPWLAGRVLQALVGAQERLAVGAVVVHILQGIYAEWDEAAASNTSGRRDKEHITGCGRRLRAAKNMGSCICAGTPEGPFTAWGVEPKTIWKNMSLHAQSPEFDPQYQMCKPVIPALRR